MWSIAKREKFIQDVKEGLAEFNYAVNAVEIDGVHDETKTIGKVILSIDNIGDGIDPSDISTVVYDVGNSVGYKIRQLLLEL